nr:unnamed protein product [Hydra vulgaris]
MCEANADCRHHDQLESIQTAFKKDVNALGDKLVDMGNPFQADRYCAKTGYENIAIRTVDTNVLIIAISFWYKILCNQLWFAFGTGMYFRYIAVHEIANSLGPLKSKALPSFHSFTDSNTTAFCGKVLYQVKIGILKVRITFASTQCKLFWGPNVKEAELNCFLLNAKPVDKWANCGKNDRDLYVPCADGDAKCGKLQCSPISPDLPVPNLPIIGTNRGTNVIGKCRMGYTSMGPDLDDPSLAMDGTKCADNFVCIKKKCTNISTIATIKKCSTTCLNGGVCNNEGNCHCPPGFACPNCEFAGPGGSLNSGQGCILQSDCGCLTPLVKGLLVLFLLVIPLLCISLYFMYRYRENIRLRFSHARETRNRKM